MGIAEALIGLSACRNNFTGRWPVRNRIMRPVQKRVKPYFYWASVSIGVFRGREATQFASHLPTASADSDP
jgi:hypothetical protein